MLMAALSELLPDRDAFLQRMNGLIPGVQVECVPAEKCGVRGSHIHIHINGQEEAAEDVSLAYDAETGGDTSSIHDHPARPRPPARP